MFNKFHYTAVAVAALGLVITTVFFIFKMGMAAGVLAFTAYLTTLEVLFRIIFKLYTRQSYITSHKIPFKQIYIEPHPYLPYAYKRHFISQKVMPANYPLNRDKNYMFGRYTSNNYRYMNGPEGNRDIQVPKPPGMIRINCIGASTTGNYIQHNGVNYSYPMELEKILQKRFPEKILEVNNCGCGGRTSAELFIDFALNLIDTEPDLVVIYHAYNDLAPSLTAGFSSDYSHAKRNLGETWYLYRLSSFFPSIPLATYNFFMTYMFKQNIRFSLLDSVKKGEISIDSEFQGLATYRRNIEHIITLCNAHGIKVVLSTFCHYMYDKIKDSPLHRKYREGVIMENAEINKLAIKYSLPFVDCFSAFQYEDVNFADSIHFTPEGMALLAKYISTPISEIVEVLK